MNRREFSKSTLGVLSLAMTGVSRPALASQHLLKKSIPSSGEQLPVIGLGTNRFGVDESAAARAPLRAALARFHKLGGKLIDTAPMYRTSETVLGDLMATIGNRDDLFIATKTDRSDGAEETNRQMLDSTRKLREPHVDLMQVHNLRGWQTALPVLRDWQQEERIRYVGITTSRAAQYEEFETVMRKEKLDFIQINYSLGQQEAAERILPLAADLGIAVIANRAFGGGRLFSAVGDQLVPEWAQDFGAQSWAQFLLKFVIGHPAVTLAIPGMTKVRHVDDNFGAAYGRLPDESERNRQAELFTSLI